MRNKILRYKFIPLSHIWSCHTERRATPTPQMGSRLLKIYGMLRQICGRPWWTSSRFEWSLVMGRQMIVPYRLARMPVHALIWTVLCKIVVFKSHTQKHTVKRARFWILILLLFARVCMCVREREGEWACVWEISRLSVLSGGVSVPRHFIQHRIHSQRIVSAMWCLGF